jgi:hypothetical protein
MADAAKPSHCEWQGTYWAPTTYFRNQILTMVMHVQIFVQNAMNASNWYSYVRWYLSNTLCWSLHTTLRARSQCFRKLSQLMVTLSSHWHGHYENVDVICKPAFSSLMAYHTLLQAFIMSLKEICVAKHEILCSHAVLKPTFSNATNQQSVGTKK